MLINSITSLKNRKVVISKVVLLCQNDDIDLSKLSEKILIERVTLKIEDPTNHRDVYQNVKSKVLPLIASSQRLYIDTSPGTPAMHAIWLILHAGGEFPVDCTLWSSQKNPETKRNSIKEIDFPINTYLSEIKSIKRNNSIAVYDATAESPARQAMFELVKRLSLIPNAPLLILGETGVGKTRFVTTIIQQLKQKQVYYLSCGSSNEKYIRRYLFGYQENNKSQEPIESSGLLAQSNGGILFLDDIEELPKSIQMELASVFRNDQSHHRNLASNIEITTNFDLISTSSKSLTDLSDTLDSRFFSQISSLISVIPPLRKCRQDIENDWKNVWREAREISYPIQAPMNEKLIEYFSTEYFPNNFRDLKRVAILIMAHWQANNLSKSISVALSEYEKISSFITQDFKEIKLIDDDLTRLEQLQIFKKKLALDAKKKHGTWLKAGEVLECDEKTLRQDASA